MGLMLVRVQEVMVVLVGCGYGDIVGNWYSSGDSRAIAKVFFAMVTVVVIAYPDSFHWYMLWF